MHVELEYTDLLLEKGPHEMPFWSTSLRLKEVEVIQKARASNKSSRTNWQPIQELHKFKKAVMAVTQESME